MLTLLGIAFFLIIQAVGYGALCLARMPRGLLQLGLAGPVGLAVLAVLTTWSTSVGLPMVVTTTVAGVPTLCGVALALQRAIRSKGSSSGTRQGQSGVILLIVALGVASLAMGVGFAGVEAPLSTHDGSHHVELIDAARRDLPNTTWYPTGLHTTIAAFLAVLPWVDTAAGAFGAALGLSLVGLVAVFGLAHSLWRNPIVAGTGALMVALTFQYPYQAQFWSGWPLAAAVPLVLGLWILGIEYLRRPSARLALIGGVLAAGIVLVHGTEVYSAAIGLLVVLVARWRGVHLRQASWQVPAAVVLALGLAVPYLPTLFHWAAGGGASAVRDASADVAALMPGDGDVFNTFGTGVGLDLPLRAALVLVGAWQAARMKTGRAIVVLGLIFLGLALVFVYLHTPLLNAVYAVTFPWAQSFRLLMVVAIAAGLLQSLAVISLIRSYIRLRNHWLDTGSNWARPVHAFAALFASLAVAGTVASLMLFLSANARVYASTSADDALAMAWLRVHAQPGEVVANDSFADAGIWAPFKAGTPILRPRLGADHSSERASVVGNIGHLELEPESELAACALDVRYVFYGSKVTEWETRHWPALAELQRSSTLEQVFASGGAVVFRTHLPCDA
jgi:hypothetical protein